MELQEVRGEGLHIDSYKPALGFNIAGEWYNHSILLRTNESVVSVWDIDDFKSLTLPALAELLTTPSTLLLIGTGTTGLFLPKELLIYLHQKKIGFEVMSTVAACRTYNLLMSEGRDVLAAIIHQPIIE